MTVLKLGFASLFQSKSKAFSTCQVSNASLPHPLLVLDLLQVIMPNHVEVTFQLLKGNIVLH